MRLVASRRIVPLLLLLLLPLPAAAEGLSFRGWGPRVGLSVDPDQVFAGVHFDLGEIAGHLRFQPTLEAGFGDDTVLVAAGFGALWFFPVNGAWKPYAGAEIGATYEDPDNGDGDADGVLNVIGGVETRLKSNNRMLFELKGGLSGGADLKLMVGWTF